MEFEARVCELKTECKSLSKQLQEQKSQYTQSMEELESRNIVLCTQVEQKSEENRLFSEYKLNPAVLSNAAQPAELCTNERLLDTGSCLIPHLF